jgi:NADH dehydrogenase I D subunit
MTEDGLRTETMVLNFGPSHPATHGIIHLKLELDGETVVRYVEEPTLGYLHRGMEKLAENMTFHQWITMTDRMNYVSAPLNNIGYTLAVEKLLGVEVPERAQYIRVILSELSRMADHLVCVGINAVDLGAFTPFLWGFQQREMIYDIFEKYIGARLTTTISRVGEMRYDFDKDLIYMIKCVLDELEPVIDEWDKLLTRNRIWIDRTRDVGVISKEDAQDWGFTGPCLRAAGVPWDLRIAEPYLVYKQLDFDIPVGTQGDVYDRYLVRVEEIRQSIRIVRQALDKMPAGPIRIEDSTVVLPKHEEIYNKMESMIADFKFVMHGIRAPEGEVYGRTEAANGELGFYIVHKGGKHPYKIHVRPPCFYLYSAFEKLIKGRMIADVISVMGSLNIIAGELDR